LNSLPNSLTNLIDQLSLLPGIGKKTAQRLAFHMLKTEHINLQNLSKAIDELKEGVIECDLCGGFSEDKICGICSDENRNQMVVCIVENAQDVFVFEKASFFSGIYHVLGGSLSPLDGIGPDDLNISKLMDRVKPGTEVVIATNPTIEGDTTALYLSSLFKELDIKVTRIARGIPVGGDLEYTDEATIIRAIEGRTLF
tara:strand:- start:1877 stop:2470 length:594 start_codon:yes stop_codon:yes gene_type:complete